jgi:probable HAF family extracellular repeat protein
MTWHLGAGIVSLAFLALATGAGGASRGWRVHDLGTLPAPFDGESDATGVNARGVVIGWSSGAGGSAPFVWRAEEMRRLLGLGGGASVNAIADDGDIVGESARADQTHGHAVLWHRGRVIDLGTLGGAVSSAQAVNNRGQVVGESLTSSARDEHAFLWKHGTMTDLGTLGGKESAAVAINDAGQVIGTSTTKTGAQHAFLWRHGTMTDLGSLPGEDSAPTAINAQGDVVGYIQRGPADPDHAVVWRDGSLRDLGSFESVVKRAIAINSAGQILVSTFRPDVHAYLWQNGRTLKIGRRYTAAAAINDPGWVVGMGLFRRRGPEIPFVWRAGTMTALPTIDGRGPPWGGISAINNHGWIVGSSYKAAGSRAVLWTHD